MSGALQARAPAKINLTLHVLGRRADGYHELQSLVAFAGVCDHLTLTPAATLSLSVDGPTAQAAGGGDDNLVLRAARNLVSRIEGLKVGAFALTKYLPVAAGVGGGSSDAAAALRLLAQLNEIAPDDARLMEAARETGADVPVCLDPAARMMMGAGENLGPKLDLPAIPAVLVNPRVAVETRKVFSELGLRPGDSYGFGKHPVVETGMGADALMSALKKGRNDLEDPAGVIAREVVAVLAVLGAARGAKLARMSGSGATCFALFDNRHQAARAARVIRRDHPNWWAKATLLR
ncbi:MAG: 4-(cytidine 5'-diphospho)-2-C-methyl-D-erythritol kinase [Methylobacteriaceae bacterium]|nr:4-(cytidine 5'-diphospho)-2-C-methyl-D-erythritol kinase [Methylobacteriaceae bacterium]